MNITDLKNKKIFLQYLISASYLYKYDLNSQLEILSQNEKATYVASKNIWEKLGNIVDEKAKPIIIDGKELYDISSLIYKGKSYAWQYDLKYEDKIIKQAKSEFDIPVAFDTKDLIYSISESILKDEFSDDFISMFAIDTTSFITLFRLGYDPKYIRDDREDVFDKFNNNISKDDFTNTYEKINETVEYILDYIKYLTYHFKRQERKDKEDDRRGIQGIPDERRGRNDNDEPRNNENGVHGGSRDRKVQRANRESGNDPLYPGVQQSLGKGKGDLTKDNGGNESTRERLSSEGIPLGVRKRVLENEEQISFKDLKKETDKTVSFFNEDSYLVGIDEKFIPLSQEDYQVFNKDFNFTLSSLVIKNFEKIFSIYKCQNLYQEEKLKNLITDDKFTNIYNLSDYYAKERTLYIEFNETSNEFPENYTGKIMTPDILSKIINLDEKVFTQEEGYYKFYINEVYNSEIISHSRVDIGYGVRINKDFYLYAGDILGLNIEETLNNVIEGQNIALDTDVKPGIDRPLDDNEIEEDIAVKVGYDFIIIPKVKLNLADIEETESKVSVNDKEYTLYKGKNYADSKKIEYFMDNENFAIYKIKDYIVLDNENLIGKTFEKDGKNYEIKSVENDKITLKEINTDPILSLVLSGGMNIIAYISDYQDEIDSLKSELSQEIKKETEIIEKVESKEDINEDNAKDFKTDKIFNSESLTEGERLDQNILCIDTLKKLKKEKRLASREEQEILSKYVGWGGLSKVFDVNAKGRFRKAQEKLKENMTSSEYESAYRTTTSAFYTPEDTINFMYKVLNKIGFKGGRILEPSMGIGNFFGLMPKELKDKSTLTGVEIDRLSSDIAKQLYPSAKISNTGFESSNIKDNSMDLVIGNVPFGKTAPFDSEYNNLHLNLHDYFILKSLDKTRPGGITAVITSSGSFNNEKLLRLTYTKAELVSAFKLPQDTFKSFAGTTVESDILIFKKREKELSIIEAQNKFWDECSYGNVIYDDGIINKYFIDNPDNILGHLITKTDRYGQPIKSVVINEGETLDEYMDKALLHVSSDIYQNIEPENEIETSDVDIEEAINYEEKYDIQNYTFGIVDEEVYYRENDLLYKNRVSSTKGIERVKGLIEIRRKLKDVINYQVNNYSEIEIKTAQKELYDLYTKFVEKHGRITSRGNKNVFSDDTTYPLLESLENLGDNNEFLGLADIFTKRTIKPYVEITHADNSVDALSLSMQNRGEVDLVYMRNLLSKSEDEIIEDLNGFIYKKTDGDYVTNDEYLSGNIGKKIELVNNKIESLRKDLNEFSLSISDSEKERISKEINIYSSQLELLKDTLPQKLTAGDIEVQIGSRWVDNSYYEQFIEEIILNNNVYSYSRPKVSYAKVINKYDISRKNFYNSTIRATETFGTLRMNALEIMERMLNMRSIEVKDKVGENEYVINKEETLLAQQKAEEIEGEFKDWIFKDEKRRNLLVEKYNNIFNVYVPRTYDGTIIKPVGMNEEIKLREHQKNAIARQIYSGRNTLLAHTVGAGKTYTMITSAMEKKRIGISNKALFVVPKPLVEQWAREFQKLYPSSNVLVTRKNEFQKKKRKRFLNKIAIGEYDAIIMSHEQFGMIPMSNEYINNEISKDLSDLKNYREIAIENGESDFSVKKITGEIERLEKNLKKMLDMKHDDVLTFEELGIDNLYVDEAHEYKNLHVHTSLTNVRGINTAGNKKTTDMLYKTRYLNNMTGYSGITFATGTPVTNTLCELYSMMRYLQPDQLEEQGIDFFDSWASQYGVIENSVDMSVDGKGYNIHRRFTSFKNTTDLINVWHTSADVVTANDLDLDVPKANYHNVEIPISELTQSLIDDLSDRIDDIIDKKVEPEVDNMLLVTNDGRTIALDTRLIDESLVNEVTKSTMCSEKVFDIYKETEDILGTQLIFCDQSVPSDKFNIYDEIKSNLIKKGIPEEEIKYIHEADGNEKKLQELFQSVKDGRVRILIGSTRKMGQGMNVQDRLVALHHMDVPWRPADLEQREGRIIRRGNMNPEVDIYRYIAKGTFDAYSWDMIIQKQKGINQLLTSKTPERRIDSFDTLTFEASTAKAIAINNPLIKEKAELDSEMMKLEQLRNSYKKKYYQMQDEMKLFLPRKIKGREERIENLKKDLSYIENEEKADFKIKIKEKEYTDKREAGIRLKTIISASKFDQEEKIGEYRGFDIYLCKMPFSWDMRERQVQLKRCSTLLLEFSHTEIGNFVRMDNLLNKLPDLVKNEEENLKRDKDRLSDIKNQLNIPFKYEEEYKTKKARQTEVNNMIKSEAQSDISPMEKLKKEIKTYLRKEDMIKENISNLKDMEELILVSEDISEGKLKVKLNLNNLELSKELNGDIITKDTYQTADEMLNDIRDKLNKDALSDISEVENKSEVNFLKEEEIEMINENLEHLNNSISFNGYTFTELHKFSEEEGTLKNISNLYTYKDSLDIQYDEFYNMTKSTYDLFYCSQTNNIYLPTIHGFMKVINERVNEIDLSEAAKETLKQHNYLDKNISSNDMNTATYDIDFERE